MTGVPARPDVLVIGGGRFGQLAIQRLPGRVAAVVEPRPSPELRGLAQEQGIRVLIDDGARALEQALAGPGPLVWVVPALPRHLLLDWLLLTLPNARRLALSTGVLPELPSVMAGPEGQAYLSLADFQCPDDCPEPEGYCTSTGLPREEPLYQALAGLAAPGMHTAVLRSHQLAPGVGGYQAAALLALREGIRGQGGRWLLATACSCHGVLNALEIC
ncbi:MAG: hypothetical protein C4525_08850 [Desulfarculus sp.]|nr:MAG: hypothetical protein C4525_08850 [Desulfarculus sp.]